VTRSVRDTAALYREMERVYRNPKLPAIGDVTHPGTKRLRIAVCTQSISREASPEVRELTLKNAALLEELGHKVTTIDNPVPPQFMHDFLLYWSFLAFALVRGGRRTFGASFDRARLDNLTLGPDRFAGRNLHRLPLAIARLSRVRRITSWLTNTYDVVLTPTLADAHASAISIRPPTTNRSSISSSSGWRSPRCRTPPGSRPSRCRLRNPHPVCRSA
jgi:amidase